MKSSALLPSNLPRVIKISLRLRCTKKQLAKNKLQKSNNQKAIIKKQ